MVEYLQVVLWCVSSSLVLVYIVKWTHECNKLSWDNPVQVTVLYFLIILVFFVIELLEIVPVELDGVLQALQAVEDGAWI